MGISLEMSQKQVISQQMLQAVKILQMSTQDLEQYIDELSMENPVVELEPSGTLPGADKALEKQVQLERSLEWLSSTDRQNRVYYEDDSGNGEEFWQDAGRQGQDLGDYLRAQILSKCYSPAEKAVMDFLIESLDHQGFLTETAGTTAAFFGVNESLAAKMIRELQSLDPAGIGASDLIDCLLLQVDRLEETEGDAAFPPEICAADVRTVIRFHLEDIGRSHLNRIVKETGFSREEVEACCTVIRGLNPRPANAFAGRDFVRYITPDAVIVRFEGRFEILMNESRIRRLGISPFYAQMAEKTQDPQLKKYLQERIRQINSVTEDINRRSSTISRVLHVLVERQLDFFRKGPGNRVPLTLSDIAGELDVHESTVSRAMQNKYLQCEWGIYPLGYFLMSPAVTKTTGGVSTDTTREAVEVRIRALIDAENRKKPLSDQAIADALTKEGIRISRRTVNKYRTEMGIPDKNGRKEP